jgi:hypothetical protein
VQGLALPRRRADGRAGNSPKSRRDRATVSQALEKGLRPSPNCVLQETLESALSVATNAGTTKWSDLSVVEDHR